MYKTIFLTLCLSAFITVFGMSCGRMPQTHYYTISYEPNPETTASSQKILIVKPLDANPVLRQDRLVYRPSEYEIKFDHYRRWVSPPAVLLANQIVKHIRAADLFDQVQIGSAPPPDAMVLSGTLEAFEEILDGNQRTVIVAVWFELSEAATGSLLYSGLAEKSAAVSSGSVEGIIESFSLATRDVLDDLVEALTQYTN